MLEDEESHSDVFIVSENDWLQRPQRSFLAALVFGFDLPVLPFLFVYLLAAAAADRGVPVADIDHLEIKNPVSEPPLPQQQLGCSGCCPTATLAIRQWEQTLAGLLPASILSAWAHFMMFTKCNRVHRKIIKPFFWRGEASNN